MSQLMVTMRDGVNKVHTFELDSSELLTEIYFKLCESHHATLVRTLEPEPGTDAEPVPVAMCHRPAKHARFQNVTLLARRFSVKPQINIATLRPLEYIRVYKRFCFGLYRHD